MRKRGRAQIAAELKASKKRDVIATENEEAEKKRKKDTDDLQKKLKEQEAVIKAKNQQLKKAEEDKKKAQLDKKKVEDEKKKLEEDNNNLKAAVQFEPSKRQRPNLVESADLVTKEVVDLSIKLAVSETTNEWMSKYLDKTEKSHNKQAEDDKEERRYQDEQRNKRDASWMDLLKSKL